MEIILSEFLKEKIGSLDCNNYTINIDISKDEFIKNIKILFLNLLYPLYLNRKNVTIKNEFNYSFDYISIKSEYIHENVEMLDIYLYLEAWYSLSKHIKNYENNNYIKKYKIDELNKYQKEAVININGPFRLLAPAGSGKTKTLINRILNLLNNNINEENILVLAFNKKAEIEINERLKKYNIKNINVKTFHSLGNKILRENTDFEFCESEDINISIIEEVLYSNKISIKKTNNYSKLFKDTKNNLLEENKISLDNKYQYKIFKDYIKKLKEEGIYFFDDMIYFSIQLILENGNLRSQLQNRYKYILVDEAQDLNNSQLLLIKILALPQNNLFIVGDDDQTIYEFRGANVYGLLNFDKEYSCCKNKVLEINYRSKANIVNNSKKFIDNNKNRIYKNFKAFSLENGNIELYVGKNIYEEVKKVVNWVKYQLEKNINYDKIAILYRSNDLRRYLEPVFIINKIPILSNDEKAFEIFELLLPYFNFIFDTSNMLDYKKIINSKKIYINNRDLQKIYNDKKFYKYLIKSNLILFVLRLKKIKKIIKYSDINFKYLIINLGLKNYIKDKLYIDNVSLKKYIEYLENFGGIKKLFNTYCQNNMLNNKEGIILSTIHKTKGNEYDSVCYFHLLTPTKDIEDERKVSYVAFTRAKNNLLIHTIEDDEKLFVKEFMN